MNARAFLLLVLIGCQTGFPGPTGTAQDRPVAFVGAHVIPMEGEVLEDATLVVQGGRIVAFGPRADTPVPEDATRHDVSGKTILPGLICTHSHVGGGSGGDRSGPLQADVRVWDSLNVRSSGLERARAGGITTVNVMPGSGHLMSGQTIYLKLRDGKTIDELVIRDGEEQPLGGMKMANGTNSQRKAPFPGTRSKSAALVRSYFLEAQAYQKKLAAAVDDPDKAPPRNLEMEALVEVLEGKRVVHHHTHRHDDILTVLRLKEEFGFRVVLHHVSDAWLVADEIAAAGVPCSIIVIDSPGGKIEAKDIKLENGKVLEDKGVLVGFHTDDPITDSRLFLRSAALAVRAGMSREKALEGVTLAGAKMLDLDQRIGSLKVGKDADFVILSGDPLSVYTRVEQTWVEGQKVFDLEDPDDRLIATGGYEATRDRTEYLCCFGNGDDS